MKKQPGRVSIHGGHSGQFCGHATGTLEEIVQAYIANGFAWVGITEHMPPADSAYLYPEEREAAMTAELLFDRFGEYVKECRRLQAKYRQSIHIFVGMETETYQGYREQVARILKEFQPDYLVGSVHHVDGYPIDYSKEEYDRAVRHAGGVEDLYCRYFDQQYEMMHAIKPAVVGHFDLIRIYDADYRARLQKKEIVDRIERNLDFIAKNKLILDYNVRALLKGAAEPYVAQPILAKALGRGIKVVPGDDSHGVDSVGLYIDRAIAELQDAGVSGEWCKPSVY